MAVSGDCESFSSCRTCCKPCSSGCHSILRHTHTQETQRTNECTTPSWPSLLSWHSFRKKELKWANNTHNYHPQTHAFRPNTWFKTLLIVEARLIHREHLDAGLHISFTIWSGLVGSRQTRVWMCEEAVMCQRLTYVWAVCECVSISSVALQILRKMLLFHFISIVSLHMLPFHLRYNLSVKINLRKLAATCSPAWFKMF